MSTFPAVLEERLRETIDGRTRELLEHRRSRSVRRRGWLVRRALLAADLLGLVLAFAISELVWTRQVQVDHVALATEVGLFVLVLPGWVIAAKLYGLYDRDEERADHSTVDDVLGVVHLVTVGTWLLFAGAYFTALANPTFPKLFTFWALAVAAVPMLRGGARAYCRRSVSYLQNTLIVGDDEVGRAIARKILNHPEYGLNIVGFVDADGYDEPLPEGMGHLARIGDCDELPALVRLLDIDRVIVGFGAEPHERLLDIVRELNGFEIQVDIVPRFYDVISPAAQVHTVEGLPLVSLRPPSLTTSSRILKRGLDLVGSLIGLVLSAPALAAIAVWIKLDSPGPALFRQERMGSAGRPFRILKLRTMVTDADARKRDLAHLNKHARNGGDPRMFKIVDDPRVTRAGRFLRRFSIDELPQLWNVLRGEMSLVGPRPLILDEHAHVDRWARRRLDLRPGITGLWQVLGRDEIPFEEMVRLDYLYVTSWSLGGDVRLLLRTVPRVVRSSLNSC